MTIADELAAIGGGIQWRCSKAAESLAVSAGKNDTVSDLLPNQRRREGGLRKIRSVSNHASTGGPAVPLDLSRYHRAFFDMPSNRSSHGASIAAGGCVPSAGHTGLPREAINSSSQRPGPGVQW